MKTKELTIFSIYVVWIFLFETFMFDLVGLFTFDAVFMMFYPLLNLEMRGLSITYYIYKCIKILIKIWIKYEGIIMIKLYSLELRTMSHSWLLRYTIVFYFLTMMLRFLIDCTVCYIILRRIGFYKRIKNYISII